MYYELGENRQIVCFEVVALHTRLKIPAAICVVNQTFEFEGNNSLEGMIVVMMTVKVEN